MGGRVLELESDKLIQRGIDQGIARGIERGIQRGIQQGIALERKNSQIELQKAEAEIQRLRKLLEEQEKEK